jgi:hypothetical protein
VGIAGWNSAQVCIPSDLSPAFITNTSISVELATASHITARPSTFLPSTILRTDSTLPKGLWTNLPTASQRLLDASTHSTPRSLSVTADFEQHALHDTI